MSNDFDTNLQDAEKLIQRFRDAILPHFINGQQDAGRSGKTMDSIAPSDNSVIGSVAAGNADDIDAACKAAEAAFEDWKNMPGQERKRLLHKVADAIIDRARDIALVESYDSGQAIRFMSKAAIRGAANFQYFADLAPGARDGHSLPADEHLNYTL
ncbi:MAG: aldehyde dehydrogenase family protein, partial [Gammaproteobacteria bacterium]|nr:aldehyde dehydrogenase family protein [Gammaproteobacteria bacterium]